MTPNEIETIMGQLRSMSREITSISTVLLGAPQSRAEGLCGEVERLRKGQVNHDRRIQAVEETCRRNHNTPPVTVYDENEFVIHMSKRRLAWWLALIVMVLASIITLLIYGTDYFNLSNRVAS